MNGNPNLTGIQNRYSAHQYASSIKMSASSLTYYVPLDKHTTIADCSEILILWPVNINSIIYFYIKLYKKY
jgi:hypothetical protein